AEGGSSGDTAVTPVIAITVSNNDTNATIGTLAGQTLTATGAVSLAAAHEGSTLTKAEGDTESGKTGVGISLALTVGDDSAIATTNRDLTSGGAMTFSARTVSSNESSAKASVAGGKDSSGGGDGGAGGGNVDSQVGNQRNFANSRSSSAG